MSKPWIARYGRNDKVKHHQIKAVNVTIWNNEKV